MHLLLAIPLIDLVLHVLLFTIVMLQWLQSGSFMPQQGFMLLGSVIISYLSMRAWAILFE